MVTPKRACGRAGDVVNGGHWIKPFTQLPTMIKPILKIGAVSLLAAAIVGLPLQLPAQTTNKTAATKSGAEKKDNLAKKKAAHPFHGKLAAVDKIAKTIQVGESTYQITSDTKITKAGKPAILDDGVVGEDVGGYVKPTADGKMAAVSVRFGPKVDAQGSPKKKDTTPK